MQNLSATNILYSFFVILSFLLSYGFLNHKLSISKDIKQTIMPLSFVGAIFGGLLYTIITSAVQGKITFGLSSLGGAIGYIGILALYNKIKSMEAFQNIFRYFVMTLPLLYGVSKFGCLIKGCCGGSFLSVDIQLIEALSFIILFTIFLFVHLGSGTMIISSSLLKLFLENFRDIQLPTVNQIVCLLIIFITLIVIFKSHIKSTTQKGERKNE